MHTSHSGFVTQNVATQVSADGGHVEAPHWHSPSTQTSPSLQEMPSSQGVPLSIMAPRQLPAWQYSYWVQPLPSSHGTPSFTGTVMQPAWAGFIGSVWHRCSEQNVAGPQAAPRFSGTATHPTEGSHSPFMQGLPSSGS
jgi:hypothetical protein